MKKKLRQILSLALCMVLSMTAYAGVEDYEDANEVTYWEAADVLSALGIIGDGSSLNPMANLTRAQAAQLIARLILTPAVADGLRTERELFSDVPTDHWAAGYIDYCAEQGLIGGMRDGGFYPG